MAILGVIPKVFYEDIRDGLHLFIDCLGFTIGYQEPDQSFFVISRDGARIILVADVEFARKDRPELRLMTDDIEAFYKEVSQRDKAILHPNSNKIKLQPWGLKEFAVKDASDVCVIIQQEI
jgi:hypothetical protein